MCTIVTRWELQMKQQDELSKGGVSEPGPGASLVRYDVTLLSDDDL